MVLSLDLIKLKIISTFERQQRLQTWFTSLENLEQPKSEEINITTSISPSQRNRSELNEKTISDFLNRHYNKTISETPVVDSLLARRHVNRFTISRVSLLIEIARSEVL